MIYELEYWDGEKIRHVAVEADSCDTHSDGTVSFFKHVEFFPGEKRVLFATFWNPVSLVERDEAMGMILPVGQPGALNEEKIAEFYRSMGIGGK